MWNRLHANPLDNMAQRYEVVLCLCSGPCCIVEVKLLIAVMSIKSAANYQFTYHLAYPSRPASLDNICFAHWTIMFVKAVHSVLRPHRNQTLAAQTNSGKLLSESQLRGLTVDCNLKCLSSFSRYGKREDLTMCTKQRRAYSKTAATRTGRVPLKRSCCTDFLLKLTTAGGDSGNCG